MFHINEKIIKNAVVYPFKSSLIIEIKTCKVSMPKAALNKFGTRTTHPYFCLKKLAK